MEHASMLDASAWVAIAFVALLLIAYWAGAFSKMTAALDARRATIAHELSRVQALREQAAAALNAAKKQMADAEREADRMVRAAHEAAERVKQQAEVALQHARERHLRTAEERIRLSVDAAVLELRASLSDAVLRRLDADLVLQSDVLQQTADAALQRSADVVHMHSARASL